jgi:hypothetical protein
MTKTFLNIKYLLFTPYMHRYNIEQYKYSLFKYVAGLIILLQLCIKVTAAFQTSYSWISGIVY